MDIKKKHCIAWDKPETKQNMCSDSIYTKFKAGKINYGNKNQSSGCLSVHVCVGGGIGRRRVCRGRTLIVSRGPRQLFVCEGLYFIPCSGWGKWIYEFVKTCSFGISAFLYVNYICLKIFWNVCGWQPWRSLTQIPLQEWACCEVCSEKQPQAVVPSACAI
jgi:hypothetical protein